MKRRVHTAEERARALGVYVMVGTIKGAATQAGVSETNMRRWVEAPESQNLLAIIRRDHARELADHAASVAGQAIDRCRERLDDPKIGARDCAIVAGIMVDKAAVLRAQIQDDVPLGSINPENVARLQAEVTALLRAKDRQSGTASPSPAKPDEPPTDETVH